MIRLDKSVLFLFSFLLAHSLRAGELRLLTEQDFLCHGQAGRTVRHRGRTYTDCAGGHGPRDGMRPELLSLLNRFQARLGRSLTVTSGYRCETHNRFSWAYVAMREGKEDGVSLRSLHRAGAAADFIVPGLKDKADYVKMAEDLKQIAQEGGGGAFPMKVWTQVYGADSVRDPDNQHDSPYIHVHLLGVERTVLPPDDSKE